MANDVSLEKLNAMLKDTLTGVNSIVKALGTADKTTKSIADTQQEYTGVLGAIYKLQTGIFGSISKEANLVYKLLDKYTASAQGAAKTLKMKDGADAADYKRLLGNKASLEEQLKGLSPNHPDAPGLTKGLSNITAQIEDMSVAGEEASGVMGTLAGSVAAIGDLIPGGIEVEALLFLLYKVGTAMKDTVDYSRQLNKELILANSSFETRYRLMSDVLAVSAATGISTKEVGDIMASLVANGQQYSQTLALDLQTSVLLHEGLGLSVEASSALVGNARRTHDSFSEVADVLTDIQERIGLSSEAAARMMLDISSSADYLTSAQQSTLGIANLTRNLAPEAAGLQSINRGDLVNDLAHAISAANEKQFSYADIIAGHGTAEQRGGNVNALVMQYSQMLSDMGEDQRRIMVHIYSQLSGASEKLLLDLYPAYKEQQEAMSKLTMAERLELQQKKSTQQAFDEQSSATRGVFEKLGNAFTSLEYSILSSTGLVHAMQTLTGWTINAAEWFAHKMGSHDLDSPAEKAAYNLVDSGGDSGAIKALKSAIEDTNKEFSAGGIIVHPDDVGGANAQLKEKIDALQTLLKDQTTPYNPRTGRGVAGASDPKIIINLESAIGALTEQMEKNNELTSQEAIDRAKARQAGVSFHWTQVDKGYHLEVLRRHNLDGNNQEIIKVLNDVKAAINQGTTEARGAVATQVNASTKNADKTAATVRAAVTSQSAAAANASIMSNPGRHW